MTLAISSTRGAAGADATLPSRTAPTVPARDINIALEHRASVLQGLHTQTAPLRRCAAMDAVVDRLYRHPRLVGFFGLLLALKVYYKLTTGRCSSRRNLDGLTAIVTGGNSGA